MATNITALSASATSNGRQGPRQFQGLFDAIPFKVTITDATLAAQVAAQADVTVAGAALGDIVLMAPNLDQKALLVQGYVSAANTVTITTFNVEGSDADTSFSAGAVFQGVVLKPRTNVWGTLD